MKTYLIITNHRNEDHIVIKKYIEKNNKVNTWFSMWKFVIFTSEMNIKEVQDDFTESLDGMLFFVSEIKPRNICGSMPSDLWSFIMEMDLDEEKNIEESNNVSFLQEKINMQNKQIDSLHSEILDKQSKNIELIEQLTCLEQEKMQLQDKIHGLLERLHEIESKLNFIEKRY